MTDRLRRVVGSLFLAALLGCTAGAWGQANLASAREGARVVTASSSQGPRFAADNLIDGDPSTSWATAAGKVGKQWAIIKLAGARAAEIGSLALDNTPTHGHPPEAGVRNFELSASTLGREEADFDRIDLFSCRMSGGRQVFTFAPARARFIKLTLKANYAPAPPGAAKPSEHTSPDFIEVNELEVFGVGESPTLRTTSPRVVIHTAVADAAGGPLGALTKSLAEVGAEVTAFPGPRGSARLTDADLLGVGVVIVTGELKPTKDEVDTLDRFVRRGGGMVCALPADSAALAPLLATLGITVGAAPAGQDAPTTLVSHWITDGLTLAEALAPAPTVALQGSASLMRQGEAAIGLAGELEKGRVVVVPREALAPGQDDRLKPGLGELARRAVLWAAGMEETPPAPSAAPLRLEGRAVLVNGDDGSEGSATFERLKVALRERGLHVAGTGAPLAEFKRSDLGDATLLIAAMPTLPALAQRDLADWVNAGGAMLVLGDPTAPTARIMEVNRFLREFGVAIASAPAKKLAVGIGRHSATSGIEALARPGDILGVWSFQGTTLAEMAGTPVTIARTVGKGRLVVMDAGFACDPPPPPADRKRPVPVPGIQLAQNEPFVAQCVAWLLGAIGNGG